MAERAGTIPTCPPGHWPLFCTRVPSLWASVSTSTIIFRLPVSQVSGRHEMQIGARVTLCAINLPSDFKVEVDLYLTFL